MDNALAAEEQGKTKVIDADPAMKSFCFSWRRAIFDGSRVAFIVFVLAFIRIGWGALDALRLMRTDLVEQSTQIRMAIQLQGRDINRSLHTLDVNSGVLIDRFDIQSTHLRGQMKDVAVTAAIASKLEGKKIVEAIQTNAETKKEPPAVVPEVRIVPVPEPTPPPNEQLPPADDALKSVPQPSTAPPYQGPDDKRKGNLWKRVWSSVQRIF